MAYEARKILVKKGKLKSRSGPGFTERYSISPDEIKTYKDKYLIEADYTSCLDSSYIDLSGTGIPPVHPLFWMPDTIADPKISSFNIPLYSKLRDTGLSIVLSETDIEISFNYTMFFPIKLSNGKILLDTINKINGLRYLYFTLDSLYLDDTTRIITEIQGRPLLGNNDSTLLKWEVLGFHSGDILKIRDTIPVNGMLRSKTCTKGGLRLIKSAIPLKLMITPNPAQDKLTASINILETGMHTLELIDLQGQKTILNEFNINIDDNKELNIDIDISKISSGMYFIILSSPTDKKVEPVFILK